MLSESRRPKEEKLLLVAVLGALAIGCTAFAPTSDALPSPEPTESLQAAVTQEECNQSVPFACVPGLEVRISKSYLNSASQNTFYHLFIYRRTCQVDGKGFQQYNYAPYSGSVVFDIETYDLQNSSQKTFATAPWQVSPYSPLTLTVADGVIKRDIPAGTAPIAVRTRARIGGLTSAWVHYNVRSTWELHDVAQYWPTSTSFPERSFSGTSYRWAGQVEKSFQSRIGTADAGYFRDPPAGVSADVVLYYLKSTRAGYIVPSNPWDAGVNNNSVWNTGSGDALYWVDSNVSFGSNVETWIVGNGGAVFDRQDAQRQSWTNKDTLDDFDTNGPWLGGAAVYQGAAKAPFQSYFRNYMQSPRYMGRGWGLYVLHVRNGSDWTWIAHGDLRSSTSLGIGGPARTLLHFAYYEVGHNAAQTTYAGAAASCFTSPGHDLSGSCSGHREDHYLDQAGDVRVEGRAFGPAAFVSPYGWGHARLPAYYDPGVFHQPVIECPQYTMDATN